MTSKPAGPSGLVPDANVLIDYANSDIGILSLVARHIAPVYVVSPVLAEVAQLSWRDMTRLGVHVLEPDLPQALEAASRVGRTSFQDQLCLIVARDHGHWCVTNDKALRASCTAAGVSCLWGLEVMVRLVARKSLSSQRAAAAAERIAQTNIFITHRVIATFRKQIGL